MKKLALFLVMVFVLSTSFVVFAASKIVESPDVKIYIDGQAGKYEDVPININGRVLLPLRAISVNLGVPNDENHIIWNNTEKSVTLIKESEKIYLKVGVNVAKINGVSKTVDVPPVNYKSRVYVPVRFIAESFGINVDWDSKTKSVIIIRGVLPIKEVKVSTPQEFIKEIGSNKKIVLSAGTYNLSKVEQKDSTDGTVVWEEVQDGRELNIWNVENLTIEGSSEGKTEIIIDPRYACIAAFNNSKHISIKNVIAGHSPQEYECDAGVLEFYNCENVNVEKSRFYGCGSVGLSVTDCADIKYTDTIIEDCSLRAIEIMGSQNIVFSGCKIVNHRAYSNIVYVWNSIGVGFESCEISNNKKFLWNFFEIYGDSDVLINKCKIHDNWLSEDEDQDWDVEAYFFKTIDYMNMSNSKVVVKDSEITNNRCEYLYDDKDNVIFENCTIEDNIWIE